MAPQLSTSDESPESVACDVLVVGAHAADPGWSLSEEGASVDRALDGYLTEHLEATGFKSKVGTVSLIATSGRIPAREVAVVGLGDKEEGADAVRRAAGAAVRRLSKRGSVASTLHRADADKATVAAAEGYLLGAYEFTKYKSDPNQSKIKTIAFLNADPAAIERGVITSEATALARDLINEPAVALTPEAFARKAREVADTTGLDCDVLDEDQLRERGFGGLLGVASGSDQPPRLIRLHHKPADARAKVALVGKGITFDSGGLSLKDSKGMETMKTDMAGGAAVLGAMSALGRLGPAVEVTALIPATENMPGGRALRPGDVITHYGGRTTEVLNTDAEGRLVLADALALAAEDSPDAMVDVATLTGSIVVALGAKCTGLFATDDALAEELQRAGREAGERLWRMPLYDDYHSLLDSEVADAKNTGPRYGGAIIAALFLKDFVPKGTPWAHLDIAGAARADTDSFETPKGGTGVVTRTLIEWVEGRAR